MKQFGNASAHVVALAAKEGNLLLERRRWRGRSTPRRLHLTRRTVADIVTGISEGACISERLRRSQRRAKCAERFAERLGDGQNVVQLLLQFRRRLARPRRRLA